MAIPEYADPGSHKHFCTGYVGTGHGDNGSGHLTSWDSCSGAVPTRAHALSHSRLYCVYCGNRAFPIQSEIGGKPSGYCCVCTDAMDEVQWRREHDAILEKHALELEAHSRQRPKSNKDVVRKLVQRIHNQQMDDLEKGHLSERQLKDLGIFTIE